MKLFKRPTPRDMQLKLVREAEENLVAAEAMLEYYQHSVALYRARIERLREMEKDDALIDGLAVAPDEATVKGETL